MHTQYERYTGKYVEWQKQAERTITAWHEVAQATIKEKVDQEVKKHTTTIEDFATNQEEPLVSLLDGYEEHARSIQAKLLARFHANLTQTYAEVTAMSSQKQATPLADEETPSAIPTTSPPRQSHNETTANSPGRKASRWIDVRGHFGPDGVLNYFVFPRRFVFCVFVVVARVLV